MKKGNLNSMMNPLRANSTCDKQPLRHCLKSLRQSIPLSRRQHASLQISHDLISRLNPYQTILSFASKPDEIDLWKLNEHLAAQKKLLLPKVTGETLEVFAVVDIREQLALSAFSILEPIPELCPRISWSAIKCILVPGLGFDVEKNRIGYGKGHYDRFLKAVKGISPTAVAIGVGFKEQYVSTSIPTEPHDIPVDHVLLY